MSVCRRSSASSRSIFSIATAITHSCPNPHPRCRCLRGSRCSTQRSTPRLRRLASSQVHKSESGTVNVLVGTCGFSYRDWVGPFYPDGMRSADMLEYYARRFPAVEIDSTYYAIPKPQLFERMAARTPPTFTFTVKAPGSITHVPADAEPASSELDAFELCLAPLVSASKLGAVLAQFPHSFRPDADAHRRLALLRDRWPQLPIVCEFRHR